MFVYFSDDSIVNLDHIFYADIQEKDDEKYPWGLHLHITNTRDGVYFKYKTKEEAQEKLNKIRDGLKKHKKYIEI